MKISVAIITYNEADRIGPCLESVQFADDVVVVDAGSNDGTLEIAKKYPCRVIHRSWQGFSKQKQFAVDQCPNDWVLILDADERVSVELADEISRKEVPPLSITVFQIPRKNIFHGRWIQHCGWWPESVLRLVHQKRGLFDGRLVHEQWQTNGTIAGLENPILHHSFQSYADLLTKMQRYSNLAAHQMAQEKHPAHWWTPITHSFWMFLKTYAIQRGFLDGFDGLMISLSVAGGSFMKYAKLLEIERFGVTYDAEPESQNVIVPDDHDFEEGSKNTHLDTFEMVDKVSR